MRWGLLVVVAILSSIAWGEPSAGLDVVELWGDQFITETTDWQDTHYKIHGNVYFEPGGLLRATNCTIELMCTYSREFRYIWQGGDLQTNNVIIGGSAIDGIVHSCNFEISDGHWDSVDTTVRYTSGQIYGGNSVKNGSLNGLGHNGGVHPDSIIMNGYGNVVLTDCVYPVSITMQANGTSTLGDFSLPLDTPLTQVLDGTNVPGANWRLELNNTVVPLWWIFAFSVTNDGTPTVAILRDCPKVITNVGGSNLTGTYNLPNEMPPYTDVTVGNLTFRTLDKEAGVPGWGVYLSGDNTDLTLAGPTNIAEFFLNAGRASLIGEEGTFNGVSPCTTCEAGRDSDDHVEMYFRNAMLGADPSRDVHGQLTARGTSTAVIEESYIRNLVLITEDSATISVVNCIVDDDILTMENGGPITFDENCRPLQPLQPGVLAGDDFDSGFRSNIPRRWHEFPCLALWPEESEYAFGGHSTEWPIRDGVLVLTYSELYDRLPVEGRIVCDLKTAPVDMSSTPLYLVLRYRANITAADENGNMMVTITSSKIDWADQQQKRRTFWIPANQDDFTQVVINLNDDNDIDPNLFSGSLVYGSNGNWLPWSSDTTYVGLHLGEPQGGQTIHPGDTMEIDHCVITTDYTPYFVPLNPGEGEGELVTVRVPDVLSLTESSATQALEAEGLVLGTVSYGNSSTYPSGQVMAQSPVADTIVYTGTVVNVMLSSGTGVVFTGAVRNSATLELIEGATVALSGVGEVTTGLDGLYYFADFSVGSHTVQVSAPGYVTLVFSGPIALGQTVTLDLTLDPVVIGEGEGEGEGGPQTVIVPDVIGLGQTAARQALEAQGLTLGAVSSSYSATYSAGQVMAQSPSAGSTVDTGTAVEVTISTGRGTKVSGTVRDAATQEPLAGATVSLAGVGVATTDTDGTYQFMNFPAGNQTLQATAQGYVMVQDSFVIALGETVTKNFALSVAVVAEGEGEGEGEGESELAGLSGFVRDQSTSQPINGASVTIVGAGSTLSGANGSYSLTGITAGTQTVLVTMAGYVSYSTQIDFASGNQLVRDFNLVSLAAEGEGEGESEPADVNGDHNVNAVDVQLVINFALGLGGPYDCDVDNDTSVNAVDVQLVINAALGL